MNVVNATPTTCDGHATATIKKTGQEGEITGKDLGMDTKHLSQQHSSVGSVRPICEYEKNGKCHRLQEEAKKKTAAVMLALTGNSHTHMFDIEPGYCPKFESNWFIQD